MSPPKDVVEVGTPDPTSGSNLSGVQKRIRVTNKLHDEMAYERRRRRKLYDQMVKDYNKIPTSVRMIVLHLL